MNDGMNGVEIMVSWSKAKFSERFYYFYLLGNMIKKPIHLFEVYLCFTHNLVLFVGCAQREETLHQCRTAFGVRFWFEVGTNISSILMVVD